MGYPPPPREAPLVSSIPRSFSGEIYPSRPLIRRGQISIQWGEAPVPGIQLPRATSPLVFHPPPHHHHHHRDMPRPPPNPTLPLPPSGS